MKKAVITTLLVMMVAMSATKVYATDGDTPGSYLMV